MVNMETITRSRAMNAKKMRTIAGLAMTLTMMGGLMWAAWAQEDGREVGQEVRPSINLIAKANMLITRSPRGIGRAGVTVEESIRGLLVNEVMNGALDAEPGFREALSRTLEPVNRWQVQVARRIGEPPVETVLVWLEPWEEGGRTVGVDRAIAERYLRAVAGLLEKRLRDSFKATVERESRPYSEYVDSAEAQLHERQERMLEVLKAFQSDLDRMGLGFVEPTREGVMGAVRSLQGTRQELRLELAGMQARQNAIAQRIAETAKGIERAASTDEIAGELARMVEFREAQVVLTRRQQGSGVATENEVMEAEAQLAEARVRLLSRREDVVRTRGGDRLEGLREELADLAVQTAEIAARLGRLDEQLSEDVMSRAVELAQRYEMELVKLDAAKNNFEGAVREEFTSQMRQNTFVASEMPSVIMVD